MIGHRDTRRVNTLAAVVGDTIFSRRTPIAFIVGMCIGALSTVDSLAARPATQIVVPESPVLQTLPAAQAGREIAEREDQAGDNKPKAVASPRLPARIAFEQLVYDFGTVEQGEKVTHMFRFTNQGGKGLRVASLKTSCGCTAAVVSEKVIPSGGEGAISATFDTSGFIGEKKKTIGVHTNDPNQAITTLTMQGEIRVEVSAEPPQLYVGRLQRGRQVTRTVEILSDIGSGITITKVENSHPSIRVQTEALEKNGRRGKRLLVTVAKDTALGRLNDQITVKTTSKKRPSILIPVFGSLEGDLLVQPPQVTFGVVQPGQTKTRKVNIKNQAKTPVKITDVKSTAKGIVAVAVAVTPGAEYNVTLTTSGSTVPGPIRGEIKVSTDHPEERVLSIPLYGRVADGQQARP